MFACFRLSCKKKKTHEFSGTTPREHLPAPSFLNTYSVISNAEHTGRTHKSSCIMHRHKGKQAYTDGGRKFIKAKWKFKQIHPTALRWATDSTATCTNRHGLQTSAVENTAWFWNRRWLIFGGFHAVCGSSEWGSPWTRPSYKEIIWFTELVWKLVLNTSLYYSNVILIYANMHRPARTHKHV